MATYWICASADDEQYVYAESACALNADFPPDVWTHTDSGLEELPPSPVTVAGQIVSRPADELVKTLLIARQSPAVLRALLKLNERIAALETTIKQMDLEL